MASGRDQTTAALGLAALIGLVIVAASGGRRRGTAPPAPPAAPRAFLDRSMPVVSTLDNALQPLALEVIRQGYFRGIPMVVHDGFRDFATQDADYAQGRTTPGPIVTWARGGSSWHNFGLAFDLAPLDPSVPGGMGKVLYPYPNSLAIWQPLGEIGESLGLEWGGRWPAPKTDLTHFEYHPGGLTLAMARAGQRPAVRTA